LLDPCSFLVHSCSFLVETKSNSKRLLHVLVAACLLKNTLIPHWRAQSHSLTLRPCSTTMYSSGDCSSLLRSSLSSSCNPVDLFLSHCSVLFSPTVYGVAQSSVVGASLLLTLSIAVLDLLLAYVTYQPFTYYFLLSFIPFFYFSSFTSLSSSTASFTASFMSSFTYFFTSRFIVFFVPIFASIFASSFAPIFASISHFRLSTARHV